MAERSPTPRLADERDLFEAMLREDDDERRAGLTREYVGSVKARVAALRSGAAGNAQAVFRYRDKLKAAEERAECAERDSGVWEARFMDEQSARRAADAERDEAQRAFKDLLHALEDGVASEVAEHERVRREVAEELLTVADHEAYTIQPKARNRLRRLADRLVSSGGEETDA